MGSYAEVRGSFMNLISQVLNSVQQSSRPGSSGRVSPAMYLQIKFCRESKGNVHTRSPCDLIQSCGAMFGPVHLSSPRVARPSGTALQVLPGPGSRGAPPTT
ncbi:hypothetical protein WA026_023718 [Henosepilachna vigintioctopunctata]|uniref:Uncharacterized protein n=1 Tax=Henosepilachna vigintioctopunctata TaxID=420089 RepID=A0AAW1VCW5_9CUCU